MSSRAADSFTILQAHNVKAADVTFIEDRSGEIGVFQNATAKRLGTLMKAPVAKNMGGFWLGAAFGFGWAAILALIVCRYCLTIAH